MKTLKYIALSVTLSLFLVGCPTTQYDLSGLSEQEAFEKAQDAFKKGAFREAIGLFENIESLYPYGSYNEQITLDLIYSYYKTQDYVKTLSAIDNFIQTNPASPSIDYIYYMRGLVNMAFDENSLHGLFRVDRSDRDPAYARIAFSDFSKLVQSFPNSLYVADAKKRMVSIKERLAKYELQIAEYYYKRGAYVAAINRVTEMLVDFSDTISARKALVIMKNSYHKLDLKEDEEKVEKLIEANKNNI